MSLYAEIRTRLVIDPKVVFIYATLYLLWGIGMNEFGIWAEIARFKFRIQIFICYVLFMVPVSIVLRKLPWYSQYAFGTVLMGFYEFGGYALKTSIVYENNLIEQLFSPQNFSLSMTLFFGLYFPIGNYIVGYLAKRFGLDF